MEHCFICTTCGVQYSASAEPPAECIICSDDRQYVNPGGQSWTTLDELNCRCKNIFEKIAPGIFAIYTTPSFAIGQRAHLLLSPAGNVLWDCITALDEATVELINGLGGISAIAISHPHYFSTICEWSQAFGDVPVYIHAADRQWVTRKEGNLQFWDAETFRLNPEMELVRCGGHFPGASVLHWSTGAGSLFAGDTIQVTPGNDRVSFMYSYPNMIPLAATDIRNIATAVEPLQYDAMYGAFDRYIRSGAKEIMKTSVERYLQIFND
ncbi:MAG: MBL fold metallo-hydrolase [Flavisolibacter sp.]